MNLRVDSFPTAAPTGPPPRYSRWWWFTAAWVESAHHFLTFNRPHPLASKSKNQPNRHPANTHEHLHHVV